MKDILAFVREVLGALLPVEGEDYYAGYRVGYGAALREVEEQILDLMWEAGDDDEEA